MVVDADLAPNARLRTLVHESIHASESTTGTTPRPHAEVIVDTTRLVVLGGLGLTSRARPFPTSIDLPDTVVGQIEALQP
jgi:hypothetical protein